MFKDHLPPVLQEETLCFEVTDSVLGKWMPCLPEGQELCGVLSGVLSKVLFPPSTFSGTCSGPIISLVISALNSPSLVGIMLSGGEAKNTPGST